MGRGEGAEARRDCTQSDAAVVNVPRLAIVFAGSLVFLVLGLALLIVCLRAIGKRPSVAEGAKLAARPSLSPSPMRTLDADVEEPVIRAVRFLKTTQLPDGSWPGDKAGVAHPVGHAALPGLALLASGVPPSDPNVQRAAGFVRSQCDKLTNTRDIALALLFLDRLNDTNDPSADDRELVTQLAVRLAAGQSTIRVSRGAKKPPWPAGGWSSTCPLLTSQQQARFLDFLREGKTSLAPEWKPLRPPVAVRQASDNANTQFAVLALMAAKRRGVPVEGCLALAGRYFLGSQNEDGSWDYDMKTVYPGKTKLPTMTSAGLLGLEAAKSVDATASDDAAIQKGLKNLEKGFRLNGFDPYFAWSVQQFAVTGDMKTIGDTDWYAWGKEYLLKKHPQLPRGYWRGGNYEGSTPVLDTSFALLFLTLR